MVPADRRGTAASVRLAVRLHDVSGDLAIGIALLKGWKESRNGLLSEPDRTIEVFEQVLAALRELSQAASKTARARRGPTSVRESLELTAHTAGVDLELNLTGHEDWLSQAQAELVCLTGREAIRNVKRHSGVNHCRLTIDLTSCPYVMTARDWGAGIRSESQLRGGISLLEALANDMGAALRISSQPGLGAELVLTGPNCVLTPGADHPLHSKGDLSSVVAEKSAGSRKRVAPGRPIEALGQQIT